MTVAGEEIGDHEGDVASIPVRRSQRVPRRPSRFLESDQDEELEIVDVQSYVEEESDIVETLEVHHSLPDVMLQYSLSLS